MTMHFSVLTIFPELLRSPLEETIIRRARNQGLVSIECTDIREFAEDKHQMTDDRPFGGGEGMVMKPEPLVRAVDHVRRPGCGKEQVVLLSPQGRLFDQDTALELSRKDHLVLVCGRYEGVDERFIDNHVDLELSIGDVILSGGEIGALVIIDAVTRLIPGVLGCSGSAENDTFSRNLLKHPQYTRPRVFEGVEVPEELVSGDHGKIGQFRFLASVVRTIERRPDLLENAVFSEAERKLLQKSGLWERIGKLKMQSGERT